MVLGLGRGKRTHSEKRPSRQMSKRNGTNAKDIAVKNGLEKKNLERTKTIVPNGRPLFVQALMEGITRLSCTTTNGVTLPRKFFAFSQHSLQRSTIGTQ